MRLYSLARSALWKVSGFPGDRCKRFLSQSEHWSRDQVTEYRDEKLQRLVAHCYANVPYYRREMEARHLTPSDIRGAADLPKLPILTKAIIRSQSTDLLARSASARGAFWSATGGTTGEPIRVAKTLECQVWEAMGAERGLEWGGLSFTQPRVRIFGGSLGLGRSRLRAQFGRLLRGDLFVPAFELRSDTARRYIAAMRKSGLRFAVGYASALYSLALLAQSLGEQLRFTGVFPTAELLLPEWETAIRRTFQCAVLPYYGCAEVNSLAFSRPEGDGYAIVEEHSVIEVLSSRGEPALSGDGAFLLTDLDNHAMPLLRYENGDAGEISDNDGDERFSRIVRLDGRYNGFLMTDKGDLVSGLIGHRIVRTIAGVQAYQVVQEEPRRIVVKVVRTAEYTEAAERLIIERFKRYLGESMTISVEEVSSIPLSPAGKTVCVINRCLEGDGAGMGAQGNREQSRRTPGATGDQMSPVG